MFKLIISKLVICIIFILFNNIKQVQSQGVKIEISIRWDKNSIELPTKYDLYIKNECVPFLKITYRNNTDSDIYFLKVINNRNHLPFMGNAWLDGVTIRDSVFKYFPPDLTNEGKKLFIKINGLDIFTGDWNILTDTNHLQSIEDEYLDGQIGDFYWAISEQSDLERDSLNPFGYFREADVTYDAIARNLHSDFIFLSSNESYSEEYNLIGFFLVGGKYEFYLSKHNFSNFVYAESKNESILPRKIFLPNQVNGYKLYFGPFDSNKVSTVFRDSCAN